jgi:hypothetical protein
VDLVELREALDHLEVREQVGLLAFLDLAEFQEAAAHQEHLDLMEQL